MIDDKKIEEVIKDYVKYSSVEDEYPGTEGEAFRQGANWAINEFLKDLWHPVYKVPENDRYILWEEKYSGVKSIMFYNATKYNTCYDEPWNSKVASLNITRWLYIDDLLLKK